MEKTIYSKIKEPISDKKYSAYVTVQHSGLTNMFDIPEVIKLARQMAGTILTKGEIIKIMKTYSELQKLHEQKKFEL